VGTAVQTRRSGGGIIFGRKKYFLGRNKKLVKFWQKCIEVGKSDHAQL
jgi:hypothetical protein